MGMAQLSLKELQDMFKAYLQDLLGKDGVRQTYPQADATTGRGNSQPFQNPAEDICYYTVLPADNAINRHKYALNISCSSFRLSCAIPIPPR